jgi:hypothetical protein
MNRARAKAIALKSEADAMNKWLYVSLHSAAAAAFIFLLQRFFMNATLESSLLWAVVFAGAAATLAYKQTNR